MQILWNKVYFGCPKFNIDNKIAQILSGLDFVEGCPIIKLPDGMESREEVSSDMKGSLDKIESEERKEGKQWSLVKLLMCILVFRVRMAFYILTKGYWVQSREEVSNVVKGSTDRIDSAEYDEVSSVVKGSADRVDSVEQRGGKQCSEGQY